MPARSSGWRRSRRAKWRDLRSLIRTPAFKRLLGLGLSFAALLYVGLWLDRFWDDSLVYADVGIADTQAGTLYGVGNPKETRTPPAGWVPSQGRPAETTRFWRYETQSGGQVEVAFGEDGKVDWVSCEQAEAQPQACPSLFGIGLGDAEDRLQRRLGAADREALGNGTKVAVYGDIGAEYGLKQFRVYKITARRERASVIGRIPRFLRSLVP